MRIARHKRFFLVHKARCRLCTAAIAEAAFETSARRSGLQPYHFFFAQDNSTVLYIFYLTVNFYVSSNDFGIIEVEFDSNFLYGLYWGDGKVVERLLIK